MSRLTAVAAELLGLFVEDAGFAAAIAVWLAATRLVLPRLGIGAGWQGVLLFAGLALILVESAVRAARRAGPGRGSD